MRVDRTLLIVTAAVATGLTGVAPVLPASAAEVNLVAHLNGGAAYSSATGSSDYDRDSQGRDVEVTVRNVSSLTGKRLTVIVNHSKVGKVLVREGGFAHREWDTDRGQTVPTASVGDPVRVRAPNGALVVRGRYRLAAD